MAPEPTEADRARDLHADLAFLAAKDAIPRGVRPPVWDVEDDVDVSARAYQQGAWPAAIRRALAAEAEAAALRARVAALAAALRPFATLGAALAELNGDAAAPLYAASVPATALVAARTALEDTTHDTP